jgi:hypothetical protein
MKRAPTVPVAGALAQDGVLDELLTAIDEVLLSAATADDQVSDGV